MSDTPPLRTRVDALTPTQRLLLARQLAQRMPVAAKPARLAVCVATRKGAVLAVDEVRAFARQRLADYMLPQVVTVVERLPRTAAGKLDRRALRALEAAAPVVASVAAGQRAASPAERTLCAIWCDVLGLDEVDVHDDFFEVGGDSLLSIRILSRARKAGLTIEPEAFFEHPTIAAQAALAQAPAAVATPAIDAAPDAAFGLASLDAGELLGISRMLDELDDD